VAASAWVGGLLALAVVIFRSEPRRPPASLAVLAPRFSRLTCHTVRGETAPAPSRPRPDLTDAGSRHPGYLVESIMNPNAMIVDGPGYTDDRGSSIMPDYRDNLTVGELIDLVAYLRTLQAKPDAAGAGS
jgi:Cytochrome c